jgi:SAM-dependent methyltransferase
MDKSEEAYCRPVASRRASASREETIAHLRPWIAKARRFSGWDFSDIRTRMLDPGPPWDYVKVVRDVGVASAAVLDMGTGGGELLALLRRSLPSTVVATEEWSVNVPVAARRLVPLRVEVVRAKSRHLPFARASFDLVINRHEELEPREVDRILRPGGLFVTQQVGHHDWKELPQYFHRMSAIEDLRSEYANAFRDLGYDVEEDERDYRVAYPSLGEFVFMLTVTPWTIPDFDVERDLDALRAFEADHATRDGVVVTECRFLLLGRKPA